MPRLRERQRAAAITMLLDAVAANFGVHRSTICRLYERRTNGTTDDRPRIGRPRVTSRPVHLFGSTTRQISLAEGDSQEYLWTKQ